LPILLLGRDLTIRRFTPMAEKLFNLLPSDIGRSLSGVRHNLDLPDLEQLLRQVIDTVSSRERETWDKSGRWYTLRARPYMTLDNKIDGAVLVMVDIDDLKRTQHEITVAREYAESILEIVPPLLILDENLRVLTANESFYKHFQLSPEQTEKRLVYELDKHQWDIPKLRKLLEEILPRNSFFDNFEVTHGFGGLGQRTLHLSAHRVDHLQRILLSINDITERLQLETEVQRSELRYRRLFEAARDGILILDPETRKIKDANPYIVEFLGYAKAEVLGKELFELGLLKDEQASRQVFRDLKEIGFIRFENLPLETKGGQRREVEFVSNLYRENGVEVIQCNIRDISERKRAEEALRLAHAELGSRAVELDRFNRLAVGREQRVIELKNEVNELCQSNGQPPRHPLDSKPAQDATD
jgi:two-component system CheB/CheR fusion protein